ncbi:unnamed protein product [Pedinophyceae sp. YPF-701]|nr:unnamed protein product [Pedinophyceae sp. YPF-701]
MRLEELKGQEWLREPCILGVDEAGRGPVLGPMVYGVAFCPVADLEALKKKGFADSKALTEERRDTLFEDLLNDPRLGFLVDSLSAATISAQMLAFEKISLNVIANESTFGLIRACLDAGVNLTEVYVDTVGAAQKYEDKLSQMFSGIKFTVRSKADALYPIVSAASIAAKVTRDRQIANFAWEERFEEGSAPDGKLGSGYPSDPATKAWLANNVDAVFGFPNLVRFSWATCAKLLEERAVPVEFEADEDDKEAGWGGAGERPAKRARLQASGSMPGARHSFFRARGLRRVVEL